MDFQWKSLYCCTFGPGLIEHILQRYGPPGILRENFPVARYTWFKDTSVCFGVGPLDPSRYFSASPIFLH